jgi:hypothetical protein
MIGPMYIRKGPAGRPRLPEAVRRERERERVKLQKRPRGRPRKVAFATVYVDEDIDEDYVYEGLLRGMSVRNIREVFPDAAFSEAPVSHQQTGLRVEFNEGTSSSTAVPYA